jgi:serine/threonine-protein kinase RsbW
MSVPPEQSETATFNLVNSRAEIERAENSLLGALERFGYSDASRFALRLAMEEAIVNAFRHGHKNLPPETPVQFRYSASPKDVMIEIEDKGPGFDPGTVRDPTLEENLELPTGRGLLLIRAYMSSVEYNSKGNRVRMTYSKPAAAG